MVGQNQDIGVQVRVLFQQFRLGCNFNIAAQEDGFAGIGDQQDFGSVVVG
jgi:hypothetical protein